MQDFYHGSKQDITDSFKPDQRGLAFATPNPKFAAEWAKSGYPTNTKGRSGPEAAAEMQIHDRTSRELFEKFDAEKPVGLDPQDPKTWAIFQAREQKYRDAINKEGPLGGRGMIHAAVYPVSYGPQKVFHPKENLSDMADYFRGKGTSNIEQKRFAKGNYNQYETSEVVEYLKGKGYDSMMLRESPDSPIETIAAFYPERMRSRFAAFDPLRRNEPDMLGNIDPDLMKYLAGGAVAGAAVPLVVNSLRGGEQR
jgi:hypothetical protein